MEGGGGAKDFFEGRDAEFARHRTKLLKDVSSVREKLMAATHGGLGYMKVRLQMTALAKSHRPMRALFKKSEFPLVGTGSLGELYFEVTPATLARAVDACRTVATRSLVDQVTVGEPLLDPDQTVGFPGMNPVFYAAKQTRQAFGPKNGVSYFTQALIESLNGLGSSRVRGKEWTVKPQSLQLAIAAVMGMRTKQHECEVDGMSGAGFDIHVLKDEPKVVLEVGLTNLAANSSAQLECRFNGTTLTRTNEDLPWRNKVDVGECHASASFPAGSSYRADSQSCYVLPPHHLFELEV